VDRAGCMIGPRWPNLEVSLPRNHFPLSASDAPVCLKLPAVSRITPIYSCSSFAAGRAAGASALLEPLARACAVLAGSARTRTPRLHFHPGPPVRPAARSCMICSNALPAEKRDLRLRTGFGMLDPAGIGGPSASACDVEAVCLRPARYWLGASSLWLLARRP